MLRRAAAIGLLVLSTFALASVAHADSPIVDGGVFGVDTIIIVPGSGPSGGKAVPGQGLPGGVAGTGGAAPPACTYVLFHPAEDPTKDGTTVGGAWYTKQCLDGTIDVVFLPNGAAPVAGNFLAVTPAQLAQRAFNRMVIPEPAVEVNPATGPGLFQLVHFPVWWWLDDFTPLKQRTTLGPVWAEVTATPVSNSFDGGEGADLAQCDGPGLPWRPGLKGDDPAACSYTYRHAANSVTATVTVTWQVTWVGSGGSGGTLPQVQRATDLPLTVYERQAINVPVGS